MRELRRRVMETFFERSFKQRSVGVASDSFGSNFDDFLLTKKRIGSVTTALLMLCLKVYRRLAPFVPRTSTECNSCFFRCFLPSFSLVPLPSSATSCRSGHARVFVMICRKLAQSSLPSTLFLCQTLTLQCQVCLAVLR